MQANCAIRSLFKDQMGMGDADQFESLLGVADKKKGKVKDKWDKGKETVKYYTSKDGATKESMKKLGKDVITTGVEFGADLLGGV